MKPNCVDQRRGSLLNTPDHPARKQSISDNAYLDGLNGSSSTTNSTCSNDALSDVTPYVPPVPPRILNPPPNPRNPVDPLIIIDDTTDSPPRPVARTKTKMPMIKPPHPTLQPIMEPRFKNANSFNVEKNNGFIRASPLITDLPPKPLNHKLNMTNESNMSEVRRIPSEFSIFHFLTSKFAHTVYFLFIFCCIFSWLSVCQCVLQPTQFVQMSFFFQICYF